MIEFVLAIMGILCSLIISGKLHRNFTSAQKNWALWKNPDA
jgi:hypothetical protein